MVPKTETCMQSLLADVVLDIMYNSRTYLLQSTTIDYLEVGKHSHLISNLTVFYLSFRTN